MDRRLTSIRDHMEKDGIDACVFTSYYNIYYFSDFLYCSMGRQYAMIVTDENAITITPCRYYTVITVVPLETRFLYSMGLKIDKHQNTRENYTSIVCTT